jgi:hypothetical protein
MASRSLCTVAGARPASSSQYGHMPSTSMGTARCPGPAGVHTTEVSLGILRPDWSTLPDLLELYTLDTRTAS